MANKVSIFITNSEGSQFELSNEKMAIIMACDRPLTSWDLIFKEPVSPYDIIISDLHNSKMAACGFGCLLVQHCNSREQAEKIIEECRSKLHNQYERMMMIRTAKKYNFDENIRLKIEREYFNSDNYEVKIEI